MALCSMRSIIPNCGIDIDGFHNAVVFVTGHGSRKFVIVPTADALHFFEESVGIAHIDRPVPRLDRGPRGTGVPVKRNVEVHLVRRGLRYGHCGAANGFSVLEQQACVDH